MTFLDTCMLVVFGSFPLLHADNSTDGYPFTYNFVVLRSKGDYVDEPFSVPESIPVGEWLARFYFTHLNDTVINYQASDCHTENELFTIIDDPYPQSQLLRLTVAGQLDYEQKTQEDIPVECETRNGITPRAKFQLSLQDVNDNAPAIAIFRDQGVWDDQGLTIFENTPVGTPVAYVIILDEDAGTNGQVQCALDTTKFRLHATRDSEFEISTAEVFDYETDTRSITVTLSCEDESPEERLGSSVSFHVKIGDRNDNRLRMVVTPLGPNNTLTVLSDLTPGSMVARVAVFDADMDGQQPVSCQVDTYDFSLRNIYHGQYLLETARDVSEFRYPVFPVQCSDDNFTSNSYAIEFLRVNVV